MFLSVYFDFKLFAVSMNWSYDVGQATIWDAHLLEAKVFHGGEDVVDTDLPVSEDTEESTDGGPDVHEDNCDEPVEEVSDCWHFVFILKIIN